MPHTSRTFAGRPSASTDPSRSTGSRRRRAFAWRRRLITLSLPVLGTVLASGVAAPASASQPRPADPAPSAHQGAGAPSSLRVTHRSTSHASTSSTGRPSAAARRVMAHLNPVANIAPAPNFLVAGPCTNASGSWSCANPCLSTSLTWPSFTDAPACNQYVLRAIDHARAVEGLAPMTLPSTWYSLTTTQQLFVVTNLERVARGLRPYRGLNATLSAAAQRAAASRADPALARGFAVATTRGVPAWGGAWSGGFSVLAADYMWMYDDGWGGSVAATSNVACTTSTARGCWGHRDELLGYDPGYNPGVGLDATNVVVGAGFARVRSSSSFTVLLERPAGAPPPMTFTWAKDVAPYL